MQTVHSAWHTADAPYMAGRLVMLLLTEQVIWKTETMRIVVDGRALDSKASLPGFGSYLRAV